MKKNLILSTVALSSFALFFPSAGHASDFGKKGTMMPSGSVIFDRTTATAPDGTSASATAVGISPRLLYFVNDNLAVGAGVSWKHASESTDTAAVSAYGIEPTLAYNIDLAPDVSLFPTASLAYSKATAEVSNLERTQSKIALRVEAPVLFHFGNFFLGAGPYISKDLSAEVKTGNGSSTDGDKMTNFGLASTFGGSF